MPIAKHIPHPCLVLLCAVACCLGIASACTHRVAPLPQNTILPNASVTPAEPTPLPHQKESNETTLPSKREPQPSPTASIEPAPAQNLPRTQYRIIANLNYYTHNLSAEQQIEYINGADEPITDVVLIVEPLRYPATFRLKRLAWEDGHPIEGIHWEINRLRFPLPQPLAPGERLIIHIDYELNLHSPDPAYYGRPVPFGYTARQTNLVDWYPFIPPYITGQGWLVHDPWFYGEHLVYEVADFEVNLRLADSVRGNSSGDEQPLTIAASAPVERDGEWYRYRSPAARNFVFSVSDMYQVLTATVGEVTVMGYAFPFHARAGEAALKTTADALGLFNQLFGAYPRPTLSVVEADFLDGMEYDGLYFLSNGFYNLYGGTLGEYLVAIAAHETCHQWFYALVGNDQAIEPWLDEALATYCERLYYENLAPQALDWWWEYRILYYQPQGWVDGTIYNPEGYRAYRDAVYLNGALFLEDLRNRIGDEVFFAFLRNYLQRYSYKQATTRDFFRILQQHTPIAFDDLLHTYFKQPIVP